MNENNLNKGASRFRKEEIEISLAEETIFDSQSSRDNWKGALQLGN